MVNYLQVGAIILAGITVAVADALIKKTSFSGNFILTLKNPWMIAILMLYIAQILFFIYVFNNHWSLGIVGNLQMIFYSITVVLVGILAFGEKITSIQGAGIFLALLGVVLINS